MHIRFFVSSLLLSAALVVPGVAANSKSPQKFFRPKAAVQKPHDAGQTVVVNAASYLPGVSPGGLATVFGTNLTDVNGVVPATTNPFPTTLANVSVTVNGVPAPIFSVAYANGEDQISFQVPWATPVGQAAADIQVFDYNNLVANLTVDSFTEDPGIFGFSQYGNTYAVALHGSDNALVTPSDPASPGEVIVLYTTGLGPVDQRVPDGYGAPSNPLAYTQDPFQVVIAGESAAVYFSGLAPGFVGLYQINVRLPGDLPAGDLTMQILSDYANSQKVLITVQ